MISQTYQSDLCRSVASVTEKLFSQLKQWEKNHRRLADLSRDGADQMLPFKLDEV